MKNGLMFFNKICLVLSTLILFSFVIGCSSKEEPKPGQCEVNIDCKGEGTKCNKGWCEDIYFPKAKIQPL